MRAWGVGRMQKAFRVAVVAELYYFGDWHIAGGGCFADFSYTMLPDLIRYASARHSLASGKAMRVAPVFIASEERHGRSMPRRDAASRARVVRLPRVMAIIDGRCL